MKCIDPWLLCNRRRCPICNQIVQLPGAPAMPDESDVEVVNDNDRLASIPRRLYNFIRRRNSYDRDNRRASVESQQSNGHYEAGEERTPLLFNTSSTVECHTCNDDDTGMHNSYLESRHPKTTQSSFRQVDDEDDELVDVKSSPISSSSGRSSSSPPAIESQSLSNNNNDKDNNNCNETMNISSSTSSSHLLPNVIKSTSPQSLSPSSSSSSSSPSVQPGDSNEAKGVLSSSPQNISTLAPNISTTTVTSSTPTTRDDSGEDDLLLTDVNVKTA
ncbi:unnamed protein product [Trichobilharzia szidati]|nr:unnamed protein product [Trichobilharzia szidati]